MGASFKGHTAAKLWCDEPFDDQVGTTYGGRVDEAPVDAELLGPGLAMVSWEPAVVRVEEPGVAGGPGPRRR